MHKKYHLDYSDLKQQCPIEVVDFEEKKIGFYILSVYNEKDTNELAFTDTPKADLEGLLTKGMYNNEK